MDRPSVHHRRRLLVATVAVAMSVTVAVIVSAPWLPRAPDLYVHLLWSWEVMRCLVQGQPPLWLPDLNAGFGSPGIRLYSPAGPVLAGILGLLLGEAGRGLRAAALLAAAAIVALPRSTAGGAAGGLRPATGVAILVSPMVAYALVGRAAWSEFLAVPVLWWIIERLRDGRLRTDREGFAVALLWLLHVPSALMAGCLGGASLLLHRTRSHALALARIALVGGGLSAWHWLPLLQESAHLGGRQALTSGIFEPGRNVLGSPTAHALDHNIWLGWVAVAMLASTLIARSWSTHPRRTILAAICIAAASPLAAPLWRPETPLQLLQFPWRWLLPATLLLVPAMADARHLRALALACLLAPTLFMGMVEVVRVPNLRAGDRWNEAGPALYQTLGANPLLVDAAQNRPPAFAHLRRNLAAFGEHTPAVTSAGGAVTEVREWSPLRRELEVVGDEPFTVALRLLDYPWWSLTTGDGAEAAPDASPGVVACRLPPGRHTIRVVWTGNPLAPVGQIVAALTALVLVLARRRHGGRS